jgi:cyclohexadienyl dehydratase
MAPLTKLLFTLLFWGMAIGEPIQQCNDCSHYHSAPQQSYKNHTSLLDTILARGHLRVGTTGDYRPFSYLTSNQTFIGADIDMASSLSSALSLPNPIHLIPTTFTNLSSDLSAGKFDIAMSGISITYPRALQFSLSLPYQPVGETACVRCPTLSNFSRGLVDIDRAGVRVGVNAGGENESFDRATLKNATLVVVQENGQLYQTLLDGRADVVISDQVETALEARLSEGKLCVVPGKPFNFVEKGYVMPRDVVWKQFVDTWVHIQVASGAWNETLGKWLGYDWGLV